MQLAIRLTNQKIIFIDIEPEQTIQELKIYIESQEKIDAQNQKILINGVEAQDSKAISSYGIKKGDYEKSEISINLILTPMQVIQKNNSAVIKEKKKICLSINAKKVITLEMDSDQTIGHLKKIIETQENIPVEEQVIRVDGREVDDSTKFSSFDSEFKKLIPVQLFDKNNPVLVKEQKIIISAEKKSVDFPKEISEEKKGKTVKILAFDHGGVLDDHHAGAPDLKTDFVFSQTDYGWRGIKNGVSFIKNLNRLIDDYGYVAVFHSGNKIQEQMELMDLLLNECNRHKIKCPTITATAVQNHAYPMKVTCKQPDLSQVKMGGQLVWVAEYGDGCGQEGKRHVRDAISYCLKQKFDYEINIQESFIFDDGASICVVAHHDGYGIKPINKDKNQSLVDHIKENKVRVPDNLKVPANVLHVSLDQGLCEVLKVAEAKQVKIQEPISSNVITNKNNNNNNNKPSPDSIIQDEKPSISSDNNIAEKLWIELPEKFKEYLDKHEFAFDGGNEFWVGITKPERLGLYQSFKEIKPSKEIKSENTCKSFVDYIQMEVDHELNPLHFNNEKEFEIKLKSCLESLNQLPDQHPAPSEIGIWMVMLPADLKNPHKLALSDEKLSSIDSKKYPEILNVCKQALHDALNGVNNKKSLSNSDNLDKKKEMRSKIRDFFREEARIDLEKELAAKTVLDKFIKDNKLDFSIKENIIFWNEQVSWGGGEPIPNKFNIDCKVPKSVAEILEILNDKLTSEQKIKRIDQAMINALDAESSPSNSGFFSSLNSMINNVGRSDETKKLKEDALNLKQRYKDSSSQQTKFAKK